MKVIKITKLQGRIIFAMGLGLLIMASVSFINWMSVPDIHSEEVVNIAAGDSTWITLRDVESTHTLSGSFVVREGTIDFIITSESMAGLTTLLSLGRYRVGQGVYRQDNVSEDQFKINLNDIADFLEVDDVWHMVFDNSNSTEGKTVDLSYRLHPHMQDTFLFWTIVYFVAGITVFVMVAVFPRENSGDVQKLDYPGDEHNPKP